MSPEVVQKIREVRLAASDLGIPQLAIITKVDEECPEAKRNLKNVYKSKHLKEVFPGPRSRRGSPPAPPPKCFDQPWRNLQSNNQETLNFVKNYHPRNREFNHLRILLHGPVGAGKSSFVNSVDSVLQGRIVVSAPTDATSDKSFTTKYKTYKFKKKSKGFYSFVFNDIMGFEKESNSGVSVEEVKLALKGHVAELHEFNAQRRLMEGDSFYNTSPTVNDKVQVLVCVIPANQVAIMTPEVAQKIREVRLAASDLGIPQLAIITKVDEECPEAKRDLKNVYKSKHLKELVDKCHLLLGLQLNCIFLVKNYNTENETNYEADKLILSALRQMITFGDDYVTNC